MLYLISVLVNGLKRQAFYAHADAEEICHCMAYRRRTSREEESSLLDFCAAVSYGK